MVKRICLIEGDGIGCEVIQAARAALEATGAPLEFVTAEAGYGTFIRQGQALPDETLEIARSADAILFGAVGSPSERVPGYRSPIVQLRRELDLYACVRTVSYSREGTNATLVVVRESTEGMYAGRERFEVDFATGERTAILERVISERATRRIAVYARNLAREMGIERVTVVHKANVLRETCGLFREVALEVLQADGELHVSEGLIDSVAYKLARDPRDFGLIVTSNLFGDVLSDIASLHAGGLGVADSANFGERQALFEPVHGSAPDIAGSGKANPIAAIRAGARMLDYLDMEDAGASLHEALDRVLLNGPHTPDLGGSASTQDVLVQVLGLLERTCVPH